VLYVVQGENDDAKVSEIEVTSVTRLGEKAEPSDFELLKVLGQGSFGKVSRRISACILCYIIIIIIIIIIIKIFNRG